MKNIFKFLFLSLLLALSGAARAEGNCPDGMYPIGSGGASACAPIPGYSQAPAAQWADRWGAIATDDATGSVGASENKSDKATAERIALSECHEQKGGICKIEMSYYNQCVAMIVGDKAHNVSHAATLDKVVQFGIQVCTNAGDTHCHVYYSACSLPKRIQ